MALGEKGIIQTDLCRIIFNYVSMEYNDSKMKRSERVNKHCVVSEL